MLLRLVLPLVWDLPVLQQRRGRARLWPCRRLPRLPRQARTAAAPQGDAMSELVSFVTTHKTCGVCKRAYTFNEFHALKCIGYVGAFRAHGKLRAVKLLNCPCGATLTEEADVPPNTELRRSWVR